jgi:hypothetical protein
VRRKKPPHRKRCKICESAVGPWTKEDAYPNWLRKRMHDWYRALPAEGVEPGWEQGRRVLLKPVCQKCQRRLNAVFENPAKPLLVEMLNGSVIELTVCDQVVLAAWFAKTAFVLGLTDTNPALSQEVIPGLRASLRSMLVTGMAPDHTTVRIAYMAYGAHQTRKRFLPPGWSDKSRYGIICVFSTVGIVCETLTGEQSALAPLIDATKDDDRFIRIWPQPVTSAVWPPAVPLAPQDVQALRYEWDHPPEIVGGNFPRIAPSPPDAAPPT